MSKTNSWMERTSLNFPFFKQTFEPDLIYIYKSSIKREMKYFYLCYNMFELNLKDKLLEKKILQLQT